MSDMFKMLPIKDFPDYAVTDDGRILSKRTGSKWKVIKHRIRNRIRKKNGFYEIGLRNDDDDKQHYKKVHRMVAEAFVPNPDNLRYVRHKDGNRYNNNSNNLEWKATKALRPRIERRNILKQRIDAYLADGLFNPEMANHREVYKLLRDVREVL